MQAVRILIVEEELIITEYLCVSLRQKGYEVVGTPRSIDEAVKEFRDAEPDLIIVDTQLGQQPQMVRAALTIRTEFDVDMPMVFLTSLGRDHSQPQSVPCIGKPFFDGDLHAAIATAIRNRGGAPRET